ncbi:MAG: helix-turn-helix transcriptional regulator [Dysgonomonas sp.]|nr:helix-turn-helix transcriptional regulator [Dysgonomonas sp.]
MKNIPTRKTSELFRGEIAKMRKFSKNEHTTSELHTHRDDYYIFLLIKKGRGKLLIDFEEKEIYENSIFCILPGQVHISGGNTEANGWFLAVDSMVLRKEYKEIFEKHTLTKSIKTDINTINDLNSCASIIYKHLKSNKKNNRQLILQDLLSSYIGIIAAIYQEEFPIQVKNRSAVITNEFKSLLSANFRLMKQPSQYASKLNISPIYLYEAVKKTTGQSVGDCIRNEIVIQAKRLLFYTTMSVKEIALELGYDDWAYFTRMFTKVSKLSPTQFRNKYLK